MKRSNFMSYLLLLATNYQFIVGIEAMWSCWLEKEMDEISMENIFFSFSVHCSWKHLVLLIKQPAIRSTATKNCTKTHYAIFWTWNVAVADRAQVYVYTLTSMYSTNVAKLFTKVISLDFIIIIIIISAFSSKLAMLC